MPSEPRIDLIYIESGGGHRAAAVALAEVIGRERRGWDVRLRSAQVMFDAIDVVRKLTGIPFQEVYNIMLRRGWTLGTAQLIPAMHLLIRALHREQVRVLADFWRREQPDLVVSLIPHYNRALYQALQVVRPGTPFVTVLTDLADYPPNFWIERQPQYLVCGTDRAVEQARRLGHPPAHILRASGMILHPGFYEPLPRDRAAGREALGLKPGLPTGLVLFGGEGSMDAVKVVRALDRPEMALQLIVLCGRHQRAAEAIRYLPHHIPIFVEGFTREVPRYMALADFFIGKPGPGSISEALAMKLPVIVERNCWTLAQERYNTEWLLEQEAGLVTGDFGQVGNVVRRLLEPVRYARMRANAAALRNTAVFEVPAMLDMILGRLPSRRGSDRSAGAFPEDAVSRADRIGKDRK